jgi:hypothetical protein
MKALSIKPRFAAAIMDGTKTKEYRTWPTKHRGRLAVHASKPVGAIVGTVEVTDCVWDEGAGCYAWLLRDPRLLAAPLPCRGRLMIWDVPAELLAALEEAEAA